MFQIGQKVTCVAGRQSSLVINSQYIVSAVANLPYGVNGKVQEMLFLQEKPMPYTAARFIPYVEPVVVAPKFKKGDKLLCVRGSDLLGLHDKGIYVASCNSYQCPIFQQEAVLLEGSHLTICTSRFIKQDVPAPEPKRVRLSKTPVAGSVLYKALCKSLAGAITPHKLLI